MNVNNYTRFRRKFLKITKQFLKNLNKKILAVTKTARIKIRFY